MRAADFDYELPDELVAQAPAPRRADARLLHVPALGPPVHRAFRDLPGLLREGDLLVLNETRVVPARLRTRRATGAEVEVFVVRRAGARWQVLLRPARRVRVGEVLVGGEGAFRLRVTALDAGSASVELLDAPGADVPGGDVLEAFGETPLPPYIRRAPTEDDRERYQTVFARVPGAVAAPTAGLHFDDAMLAACGARGAEIARLVLHVGPGTFRPLPKGDLDAHALDAEPYEVPPAVAAAIGRVRAEGGRIVAVGTTVVRALESWALAGSPAEGVAGETRLFVKPPFAFRAVDALVTNFHLPRSSLLCLVSAFAGRERLLAAYREAVRERYRFYSYGDATFLERAA